MKRPLLIPLALTTLLLAWLIQFGCVWATRAIYSQLEFLP